MADVILAFGGLFAVIVALVAVAAFVWLLIKAFSHFGETDDQE